MDKLSNNIYAYYTHHFDELSFDKQFHFASRLYLWCQDPWATAMVASLRATFSHHNNPTEALQRVIQDALSNPVHGSKNAASLRRPYFERYPLLKVYVSALFRVTFLQTVYGIDARPILANLVDVAAMDKLARQLQDDHEAIAILSTHAINFLYLYYRVFKRDEEAFAADDYISIGQTMYDRRDKTHLQLLIYLYTHCIIGDALFYARSVPAAKLPVYHAMLNELEELLIDRFDDINLDNKFEFLVCAQLAGYTTKLRDRIGAEAAISSSDEGTYLVDRHNNNPQDGNITLDASEHRNVLFIMSNRDYTQVGRLQGLQVPAH